MIPEGKPKTIPQAQGRWPHAEAQRPGGLVCLPSRLETAPSRSLEPEVTGPWAFNPRVSSSVQTGLWQRPEPCPEERGTSELPPDPGFLPLVCQLHGQSGARTCCSARGSLPADSLDGAGLRTQAPPLPQTPGGSPSAAGLLLRKRLLRLGCRCVEAPQPGLGRNKPHPEQSRQRFPARASARGASSGSHGDSAQGLTAASTETTLDSRTTKAFIFATGGPSRVGRARPGGRSVSSSRGGGPGREAALTRRRPSPGGSRGASFRRGTGRSPGTASRGRPGGAACRWRVSSTAPAAGTPPPWAVSGG